MSELVQVLRYEALESICCYIFEYVSSMYNVFEFIVNVSLTVGI